MPPVLTLKTAQDMLRKRGVILTKPQKCVYRVNLRGGSEKTAYYTDNFRDAVTTGIEMIRRSREEPTMRSRATRAPQVASRRWTRHPKTVEHGDKKYQCRQHGREVVHDPKCRASRPLCKYRRPVCRCSAAHFPHRPGSLRGCREGGIPEAILKSRSYQQAGYAAKRRHFSRTRG